MSIENAAHRAPEPEPDPPPSRRERYSILRRHGHWRDALRRRLLAAADVAGLLIAFAAASLAGGPSFAASVVLLPIWLVLAKLYGLYDQDHRALRHLTVDELRGLIAWVATATATHMLTLSLAGASGVTPEAALWMGATAVVAVAPLRAAARSAWRRLVPPERAILVGSGELALAAQRKLELFPDIHVDCVATVPDTPQPAQAQLAVSRTLAEHADVDRIIVASALLSESLVERLVRLCRDRGIKLSVVPPQRGLFGSAVQLRHIADLPMIDYSTWDLGRSTVVVKRAIDIAVCALALVVLAIPMAALALLVRLTSPGPALFRQRRAGRGGQPFAMLKFRTMTADAERRLPDVIDLEQLEDPMFKLRGDPRVTPVGRVLRRFSLDELPQLINVLRGDMSIVGPRPEQLEMVDRYEPQDRLRLSVKPGLTGPMQVYGRGDLRFDERLAVEREYIENLSLGRDLRIIALTVAAVLAGKGAY